MNDFKRNDSSARSPRSRFGSQRPSGGFGGKPSFGRSGGSFGRPQATMHQATCATCGKSCEVPFRPTGERPVYCRDCFSGTTGAPPSAGRREYPKRPFPSMPVQQAPDPRIDDVLRQLVKVQDKLERVLLALAVQKAQATIPPETVAIKPAKRTKTAKKK